MVNLSLQIVVTLHIEHKIGKCSLIILLDSLKHVVHHLFRLISQIGRSNHFSWTSEESLRHHRLFGCTFILLVHLRINLSCLIIDLAFGFDDIAISKSDLLLGGSGRLVRKDETGLFLFEEVILHTKLGIVVSVRLVLLAGRLVEGGVFHSQLFVLI